MNAKSIAALALACASTCAAAVQTYSGDAFAIDGGQRVYRETHFLSDEQRVVLYSCPDGRPFARKFIHEQGNAQAPDFDLLDARTGYREGVRGSDGARTIYVQRAPDQAEKSAALELPADGVIDAGFDAYVRKHWDALARGDTFRFNFLVPSRRTFFAFDLARVDAASTAAQLTLRLSLGAWYAFLAPSIDVTYDRTTHRLLRFAGMSNVRDEKLKNLKVRIEFAQVPTAATAQQMATASSEPLVESCTGSGP